jgi:hypothetical protein
MRRSKVIVVLKKTSDFAYLDEESEKKRLAEPAS